MSHYIQCLIPFSKFFKQYVSKEKISKKASIDVIQNIDLHWFCKIHIVSNIVRFSGFKVIELVKL